MRRGAERESGSRTAADERFALLHEQYLRHVTAYCRRRVPSEQVDEVVADVFVTAWKRIDSVPAGPAALLWLYRVAYWTIGHQWRSAARRRRLGVRLAEVEPPEPAGPELHAVQREEIDLVLAAASHLGERDAEVLRLVCWERLSQSEIADVLEIAPNAVKQRLHRARKNLTRELDRLRTSMTASPAAPRGGAT